MANVLLKDLTKTFKNVVAVNEMNLEIKDKEFLVLVGPSGCGKTTALRMVAGLEESTSGEIYIGDRLVNDVSPKDRDIAMVFQNYALYPHMTVYDNMAFGLKLRKVPKPEIKRRVQEAADLLGLGELLDRKPKQLSGGQRQRVALGRAIVREPKVFLMDEPLSNLDAKLRVQTRAELIKLHRRLGITTIYVTHDQVEAMTMGDRIVVMKDGIVQQVDTPLNLYNKPVNVFVAGFIGSPAMNFIEATLEEDGSSYWVNAGSFKVKSPREKSDSLSSYLGKKVIFGVRPEDIFDKNLSPVVKPTSENTIAAVVDVVEPMGSTVTMYLTAGGHNLTATIDSEAPIAASKPGDEVSVILEMNRTHLFSKETKKAL
ncbi:MAG: sn-glycerol-3-phosphate ABC transporter ATP-binding protein UgpC [Armatimonadota bacterium]